MKKFDLDGYDLIELNCDEMLIVNGGQVTLLTGLLFVTAAVGIVTAGGGFVAGALQLATTVVDTIF